MAEEKKSLEEIIQALKTVTETMEKESLPLDQMMALYKEGKALEKEARERLTKIDEEIRILEKNDDEE